MSRVTIDTSGGSRRALVAKIGAGAVAAATLLVTTYEGYRASVYNDPIGRLAVCYGHDDQSMKKGDVYTRAECEAILDADLLAHAGMLDCLREPYRSRLTDGQRAAFLSFTYNMGVSAFCKGPKPNGDSLAKRINRGDVAGACVALSSYVYAGGKVLPGLVKRRAAERKVCES